MQHDRTTVPRRKTWKPRGIFCLENDWSHDLRDTSTVEPILHLLSQTLYGVRYIHRNISTVDGLEHYLAKWSQKSYGDFPILYLAFHGSGGGYLNLGSGRRSRELPLDWLENRLLDRCGRRIIFIAACSTLDVNGNRLNSFLRRTGALAVCGYTGFVDWLGSAAFDLLVLGAFQENALTAAGAHAMRRRIQREGCGLGDDLHFRMVIKR